MIAQRDKVVTRTMIRECAGLKVFVGRAFAAAAILAATTLAGCTVASPQAPDVTRASGTFAGLTDEQLIAKADMIVEGTVVSTPTPQKGNGNFSDAVKRTLKSKGQSDEEIALMAEHEADVVYSFVMIQPTNVLKGDPDPGNVTVRVLGGEADGKSFVAEGFPTFAKGEKVLLFLGREFDGALGPLAVYRIDGSKGRSRDLGNSREIDVNALENAAQANTAN